MVFVMKQRLSNKSQKKAVKQYFQRGMKTSKRLLSPSSSVENSSGLEERRVSCSGLGNNILFVLHLKVILVGKVKQFNLHSAYYNKRPVIALPGPINILVQN